MESFQYNGGDLHVDDEMRKCFEEKGFVVIRGLLTEDEVAKLKNFLDNDAEIRESEYGRDDGKNRKTNISLWNHPGDDVAGIVARSQKVVNTMADLLGGEVYHYHAKVVRKPPFTGGMHVWHQDYGYWYNFGCLFPNMGTVYVAVERANQANGCLQIIEGSHKLGRFDHSCIGDQAAITESTIEPVLERLKLRYFEAQPGDTLFFHSNVMHRSSQNNSPDSRTAYLIAYNRADNDPVIKHHHAAYSKLDIVPNDHIMKCTTGRGRNKEFFKLDDDIGVKKMLKTVT